MPMTPRPVTTGREDEGLRNHDVDPVANESPRSSTEARGHELKCWPDHFRAIVRGDKTFELRLNDRDYMEGDFLRLREWCPIKKEYSGASTEVEVTHIVQNTDFGLKPQYCCMAIQKPRDPTKDIEERDAQGKAQLSQRGSQESSPLQVNGEMLGALKARLRKMAVCVYIAVEKSVADDLADGLRKAADEIDRLQTELSRAEALPACATSSVARSRLRKVITTDRCLYVPIADDAQMSVPLQDWLWQLAHVRPEPPRGTQCDDRMLAAGIMESYLYLIQGCTKKEAWRRIKVLRTALAVPIEAPKPVAHGVEAERATGGDAKSKSALPLSIEAQ